MRSRIAALAGATLLAAGMASAASAGPLTITSPTGVTFSTHGGDGEVYDALHFSDTDGVPGQLQSSSMIVDITGFSDASGTGIGSTWQLFAVLSDLTTTGGTWSDSGTLFTGGALSGTIALYAIDGTPCAFFNTVATGPITGAAGHGCTTTGPGTASDPLAIELATGTLVSGMSQLIVGDTPSDTDSLLAQENFDFVADLESTSPDLAPAGTELALLVNSGNQFHTNDVLTDPAFNYWSGDCRDVEGICQPVFDPVTWKAESVPEPASLAIFAMGLLGLGGELRRRAKAARL